MTRIHWSDLVLLDAGGDALQQYGDARVREALDEFRRTGAMAGVFFATLGLPHEREDDASTHGPKEPADVDWTGF